MNVLNNPLSKKEDRADALNELAYHHILSGDLELGEKYSEWLITLGLSSLDKRIEGLGYLRRANYYERQNMDNLAVSDYRSSIACYKEAGHLKGVVSSLQNYSIHLHNNGKYDQAVSVLDSAVSIAKTLNNISLEMACYNSRGVNQMMITDYRGAQESYLQSLKIAVLLHDTLSYWRTKSNIAIIYSRMDSSETALEIYEETQAYYWSIKDTLHLADNYGNIGNALNDLNRINEALKAYDQSIELSNAIGFDRCAANQKLNKATLLIRAKMGEAPFDLIYQALSYYKTSGDSGLMADAHIALSDCFLYSRLEDGIRMGHSDKEILDSALYHSSKAVELSKKAGVLNRISEAYEKRSILHESMGNNVEALSDLRSFIMYRDSSLNMDKRLDFLSIEMNYKRQQDIELERIATEKQRNRKNTFLILGSSLLLFALIGLGLYKRKRDAEMLSAQKDFQLTKSETEMRALRAQMNPHFIFNALNSISDFIRKNESNVADGYLAKFSRLMRLVLENSEKNLVSISNDLEALELYLSLEQLRLKQKFDFEIDISNEIDKDETMIPPLMLQPFAENSIWHGVANIDRKGKIVIRITVKNDMLKCYVEDNGVGRNTTVKKDSDHQSMGASITQTRIDMLNQVYLKKSSIFYTDLPQGTLVQLQIPLISNY